MKCAVYSLFFLFSVGCSLDEQDRIELRLAELDRDLLIYLSCG